jgi:hypothetical protein
MTTGTKTRATAPATTSTLALSYFVPARHRSAAASTPDRASPALRPAFSKPRTQPPSFSPSNRYSENIEFLVSYRKQSILTFSNRYNHRGSLAAEFPPNLRSPLAFSTEINRHTELIEPPVSHSKQRTAPQINRHISEGSVARHTAAPGQKQKSNFFQPLGLTQSGWCAFAQPLKNKDLSVRNQLHRSRIQFCETATGHLDPSAVLPDLSGGGN